MRYLILSDLHSNDEALNAVLHRVKRKTFDRVVGARLRTVAVRPFVVSRHIDERMLRSLGTRKAIVEGLKESVKQFHEATGVPPREVMQLVMMTQYFDALRRHWSGQQHHPDAPFTFGRAGSLQPATQLDNNRSTCCRKIAGTGAGQ